MAKSTAQWLRERKPKIKLLMKTMSLNQISKKIKIPFSTLQYWHKKEFGKMDRSESMKKHWRQRNGR